jgi:uncharacterized protein GlcG (DUF336 family)
MMKFNPMKTLLSVLMFGGTFFASSGGALADDGVSCPVTRNQLVNALNAAADADTTGLNNEYWGVVVNRGGVVCAVAFSGNNVGSQWLLSRQIAAAKAFTANGLSLDGKPISSGALYNFVQPVPTSGNPLFGLHFGNPVDPRAAYAGSYNSFGTGWDPMIGSRVGGTISFGGGLGLYQGSTAVGGLGLSGDTACADHSTAWRTRANLNKAPTVDGLGLDKITLNNTTGHPHCPNDGGTQGTNP